MERSVEYVRRKIFSEPGCDKFDTLADANQFLAIGCLRINSRPSSDGNIPLKEFETERAHLLPHLLGFESCVFSENRVDKYSTIMINQNHYSVPDTLVGKMVSVKTFSDSIIIYHDNTIVAKHKRSFKNHDWKIDIQHYLRTLHKKPGALHSSTALLQADTQLKYIYECYYSKDAKTFVKILELINEKGIAAVLNALKKSEKISPFNFSTDKVKVICEHAQEEAENARVIYTDDLTEKSRSTLSDYDRLAAIQSGNLQKEVV